MAADQSRVTGVVTDPSGAAVRGATVRLFGLEGNTLRSARTGLNGRYAFTGLAGGLYRIEVTANGFAAAGREVQVTGEEVVADIGLELSGVAEEVTVTAAPDYGVQTTPAITKSNTPLIETPQSVSVITNDQIADQEVYNLNEALRYTPGVQSEPFGFEPRFTSLRIRGFSATAEGLYRDGLQLLNPGFAVGYNLEPYGAERIETPRGPSSSLYGQGSAGGLVNVVSKRPTQRHFGELEFEPGTFGQLQGKLDISGPIDRNGVFAYRVTGLARDSDTQVDFIQNDRVFLAPALTWRPNQRTTLTFLSHYQRDETRASQALPAAGTLEQNPHGEIPTSRFTGEPDVDRYDRREWAVAYLFDHHATETWNFRHKLRYYVDDVDDVTIFSASLREDQRTLDRFIFGSNGELDGFATDNHAEARFSTGPVGHTLLAGLDYQNVGADSVQTFAGAPSIDIFDPVYGTPVDTPPVFLNTDTTQQQTGLYIHDQIKFYKKLALSLGLRHDWAKNDTRNNLTGDRTEQNDRAFTGRAGLVYLTDVGLAPYYSYSESFLPTLGTNANGNPFDPERGRQHEVGVKYQPFGVNSFITLAAFDLQRQNVLTPDQTNPVNRVQTGKVRSRGIELQGVASLGFGLALTGFYTYLDAEIISSNIPGEEGARPAQTPKHSAALWGDYTIQKGAFAGLGFGVGVRNLGSTFGDTPNTLRVPGVTLADAAVHFDWKALWFAVNAHNVFNNEYIASCFTRGGSFCTYGATRTVRGSVGYRW